MKSARATALTVSLAMILTACGGGDGSNAAPAAGGGNSPVTTGCAVSDQIAFADDVLNEWYLFPDLLDNTVDPASFSDVQSFLDARVAPARAQSRDVGFTFATSIAEENELIASGSSAGFGIRLVYDTVNNRVFGSEAFENGNGFQAGFDRGSELLAIGTSSSNLQLVSNLMASGGPAAVIDALGPSDPGVQRVLRFTTPTGTVVETAVIKTEFSLDPISDRYGALILDDGGKRVGYLNLRTFIVSDAADQLRDAFELFGREGVTELIFDFRYNGGGLVSVAETLGDLLGQGRVGQVFSETVLRPSKSSENSTEFFETEANALQPTKIAVISTRSTASASELVTNSMIPYLANDSIALIGSDTSGKPVGQFGFDLAACDLRVRAVTFQTVNADGNGDYFTGLASEIPNSCRATDDIFRPFGDPAEASISRALDFLAGRTCTPITGAPGQQGVQSARGLEALQPDRPSVAQYEMPGLF
ncbi:S41 family peptidase [Erythrobacter sp. YT30]|uniref:S41 family peptidase n=1 Tax=Erythrobacter sp. YT30 TaxID=1735012 RepID=UPI00076BCDEE|nr:S41 family peptidase [Erythrobacter sp. YT30]KWV91962.1 peptidase S41 [Erythrobacter sp. YT30]